MIMGKFAPVCPAHVYKQMVETGDPNVIGDYFLLLAHDVLANKEDYAELFANGGPLSKSTVILDNSVVELGDALTAELLFTAAEIVEADVLAIPDVLEDGVKTVERAKQFIKDWYKIDGANEVDIQFMFIPQGKDLLDWEKCLAEAVKADIPRDWIGIPRNTVPRIVKTRRDLIALARKYSQTSQVHLLGFSEDQADDVFCAKLTYVRGIDTAVIFRIKELLKNPPQDPGPRGDWWENAELTDQNIRNILELRFQIGEFDPKKG